MKTIIKPNGKPVTIAEYVRSWKVLKTMPPKSKVSGWECFPVEAASILRDIRNGVHDRINLKGGIFVDPSTRSPIDRLFRRISEGKVTRECSWCGASFKPDGVYQRCCSLDCKRSYCS